MNLDRLKSIKTKFGELTDAIARPEVIADNKEWTRLCKEHAELEPIVAAYDALTKLDADIAGARALLESESDPDMVELARAELDQLGARGEKSENEL